MQLIGAITAQCHSLAVRFQYPAFPISDQDRIHAIFEQFTISLVRFLYTIQKFRIADGCPCQTPQACHHNHCIGIKSTRDRIHRFEHTNDFPL